MVATLRALFRALLYVVLATLAIIVLLRWLPPPTSAFMLSARVEALLSGDFSYRNRYDWVPISAISPNAAVAVIAAEDQLFPSHAGFDFQSIRSALRHNAAGGRVRGGSTISQQTAKNLFLWSGRSYLRKGLEACLTVTIELLWPKERILEIYLNVAQFGADTYGVQAASRQFFGKDARRLSTREAATLAAVLPNPVRFKADRPSPYLERRINRIEQQMRTIGGRQVLEQL